MKHWATLLASLLLIACQSTTVHLYARYLTPEQSRFVQKQLEEEGFAVEINQLAFPSEISQSSIIYSPFVKDRQSINKLEHTMQAANWSLATPLPLSSGNHWYSKDTIALLLLPDNTKMYQIAEDFIGEYVSTNCETMAIMQLKRGEQFTIRENNTDKLFGRWQVLEGKYLQMSTTDPDWPMYYEISITEFRDQRGIRQTIHLTPMKSHRDFPSCDLLSGA